MMTYFKDLPHGARFIYHDKRYRKVGVNTAKLLQSNGTEILGGVIPFGPETEVEFNCQGGKG